MALAVVDNPILYCQDVNGSRFPSCTAHEAPERTLLREESNIMSIHELPVAIALRSLLNYGRILGSILLLGGVWTTLFVWGLAMTENWLAWWSTQTTTHAAWQTVLVDFLQTGSAIYLPACALILISLALFFYRAPRASGPLTVPLEFAVTTLCFIGVNLVTLEILRLLAQSALTVSPSAATPGEWVFDPATLITELGLALTIVMLGTLFWVQGSGRLRATVSRWRRRLLA
jgi:hypothetical protein